jgi:hypothetical protein
VLYSLYWIDRFRSIDTVNTRTSAALSFLLHWRRTLHCVACRTVSHCSKSRASIDPITVFMCSLTQSCSRRRIACSTVALETDKSKISHSEAAEASPYDKASYRFEFYKLGHWLVNTLRYAGRNSRGSTDVRRSLFGRVTLLWFPGASPPSMHNPSARFGCGMDWPGVLQSQSS